MFLYQRQPHSRIGSIRMGLIDLIGSIVFSISYVEYMGIDHNDNTQSIGLPEWSRMVVADWLVPQLVISLHGQRITCCE